MFCACAVPSPAPPNAHVCPTVPGAPRYAPDPQPRAVEHGLKTAVAIGATAPATSRFARKNYFYPDLPKGYQISQYDEPLLRRSLTFDASEDGAVTAASRPPTWTKRARLTRVHMRTPGRTSTTAATGRSCRLSTAPACRSIEIVGEPEIRSSRSEARRYLRAAARRARLPARSTFDAETSRRAQFGCDANVSHPPQRKRGEASGPASSSRTSTPSASWSRRLASEIAAPGGGARVGRPLVQETRGWDERRAPTLPARQGDLAHDYRYFPRAGPAAPPERRLARGRPGGAPGADLGPAPLPGRGRALAVRRGDDVADEGHVGRLRGAARRELEMPPRSWRTSSAATARAGSPRPPREQPPAWSSRADAASLVHVLREVLTSRLSRANAKEVVAIHVASGQARRRAGRRARLRADLRRRRARRGSGRGDRCEPGGRGRLPRGKGQAAGFLVGQVMKATPRPGERGARAGGAPRLPGPISRNTFRLDTVIPPNTTAQIYVPTTNAAAITESGVPAASSPGVTYVGVSNGYAIYNVGSGHYVWASPLPSPPLALVVTETDSVYAGGSFPPLSPGDLLTNTPQRSWPTPSPSPENHLPSSALYDGLIGAPLTTNRSYEISGGAITFFLGSGANGTGYYDHQSLCLDGLAGRRSRKCQLCRQLFRRTARTFSPSQLSPTIPLLIRRMMAPAAPSPRLLSRI